jgi:hypothetical protein
VRFPSGQEVWPDHQSVGLPYGRSAWLGFAKKEGPPFWNFVEPSTPAISGLPDPPRNHFIFINVQQRVVHNHLVLEPESNREFRMEIRAETTSLTPQGDGSTIFRRCLSVSDQLYASFITTFITAAL